MQFTGSKLGCAPMDSTYLAMRWWVLGPTNIEYAWLHLIYRRLGNHNASKVHWIHGCPSELSAGGVCRILGFSVANSFARGVDPGPQCQQSANGPAAFAAKSKEPVLNAQGKIQKPSAKHSSNPEMCSTNGLESGFKRMNRCRVLGGSGAHSMSTGSTLTRTKLGIMEPWSFDRPWRQWTTPNLLPLIISLTRYLSQDAQGEVRLIIFLCPINLLKCD